jgi:hypothetical protein
MSNTITPTVFYRTLNGHISLDQWLRRSQVTA